MTWFTLMSQATQTAPPPGAGDEGSLLLWGIVLLTVAAVLVFMELLVPSGGIIGLAAAACAVGGLVCLTYENTQLGVIATLGVLIATPFIVGFMLKVWPNTPVGRLLILGDEPQTPAKPGPRDPEADPAPPGVQVGATGKAITPLRPVGTCLIHGQRIECLSDDAIIDAGVAIKVVDVDGNEVHVRAVD